MAHAPLGREHIQRQRRIIQEFGLAGHDTTIAKSVLQTFEETQAIHEDDVERFTAALAKIS